mgnify:CR=1 FL=1
MSWIAELRSLPPSPTIWYEHIVQNTKYHASLARVCPFDIVRIKPTLVQFDLMRVSTARLIQMLEEEYPHLNWVRETLTPDQVCAIYIKGDVASNGTLYATELTTPGPNSHIDGFMFRDAADAVTFKLMWSQYLC